MPLLRLRLAASLAAAATVLLCLPVTGFAANGEGTPLQLEPAPADVADKASGGSGLLRTIVGLVVVIALIYGITWVLKAVKRSREAQASGTALNSVASLPLGTNRSLHLVRAGDVVVLLGVSEGGITPIRTYHEEEALALGLIPAEPVPDLLGSLGGSLPGGFAPVPAAGGRLARVLEELRRRTVIR